MRTQQFAVGQRVTFMQDANDSGTITKVVRSRYCPSWDKDQVTPLDRAIAWYLVTWDEPARPGEADPETWWSASDLNPALERAS